MVLTLALIWVTGAALFWMLFNVSRSLGRGADPELWTAAYVVFASVLSASTAWGWWKQR
jgi:hypothetical protein